VEGGHDSLSPADSPRRHDGSSRYLKSEGCHAGTLRSVRGFRALLSSRPAQRTAVRPSAPSARTFAPELLARCARHRSGSMDLRPCLKGRREEREDDRKFFPSFPSSCVFFPCGSPMRLIGPLAFHEKSWLSRL